MIQKIWIKHVRNLNDVSIDLLKKKHCYIYGDNNQGKTSILEAISLATDFKSPIQDDIDKIMQEQKDECIIGLDINEEEPQRRYIRFRRNGKKEIVNNSKSCSKKDLQTHFSDYISADALHVFQKEPDFRRKLLDKFCCLKHSDYEKQLKVYEKLLRQKNKYLKQENSDEVFIKTLNASLASTGSFLVKKRKEALNEIELEINTIIRTINFFNDTIEIQYIKKRMEEAADHEYEAFFLKTLNQDIEKEKILKYSLSGPQRDDFSLLINQKSIGDYFSRGINRCLAILFRLAQINNLQTEKKLICLLLDDTFAEVDDEKKKKILLYMKKNYQLFYATTQKDTSLVASNEQVIAIHEGKISYE
tara:strand:- start:18671 stop:19753 length:1083 start_codon:yes stop_codon:yes gene_type:complete